MKKRLYPIAAALIVLAGACKEPFSLPTVPPGSGNWLTEQRVAAVPGEISVMTQNLYVGADVDLVIRALGTADPGDDFPALLFAIETVGKTDFPARAAAIADEIARRRPHAVGLQEVSQINIDLRPLGVPAVVNQDFLALLQDALAARGVHYQVAATSDNIDVNLVSGLVRLRDHDALLIDADRVTIDAAGGQDFSVNLGQVADGVVLIRGWVFARTTIDGRSYTFASAHTEANLAGAPPGLLEQIRAAQVGEMMAALGSSTPIVLMGDLNDTPGSPMYGVLASSGFTDTWTALRPGVAGQTCCHVADLSDQIANFDQRIDYVWTRGFAREDGKVTGSIDRFGNVPADRLPGPAYPIWPSDHAGLVAALR
ncbi:MAG TPA: endonuclease/exonuclease/phosphatase family protein [Gemmatimonadales bacterium]